MRQFFAPISKINKKTREVEGILALEVKDKEGEIMDYESSKPYFEKWSKGIHLASGGKSVGNLRVMHQPIVAGKFTSLTFDDDNKKIHAVAKVSKDSAWQQVLDGELNGFSIYGNPIKRTRDKVNKAIRYTVEPLEGSLVDNPCMYGADFTLIREDGQEVVAKFAGDKKPYQTWICRKDCDILHKTEEEAEACSGVVAKSSIESLDFLDDLEEDKEDVISKSMYDVSSLASNISSLKYLEVGEEQRKKFASAIKGLFSVLTGMVKSEQSKFADMLNQLDSAAGVVKSVGLSLINKGEEMEITDKELDELADKVVEKIEKTLSKKIAKSVGVSVGEVVEESLEESEVITNLIDTVNKVVKTVNRFGNAPKKTNVVSKSVDTKNRKHTADDDGDIEEIEEIEKKKVEPTSNKEDLLPVMKAAMKRSISYKQFKNTGFDEPEGDDDPEGEEEDGQE